MRIGSLQDTDTGFRM